jgi:hypothetical protein
MRPVSAGLEAAVGTAPAIGAAVSAALALLLAAAVTVRRRGQLQHG